MTDRVVDRYGELQGLVLCFGQGSAVMGFSESSDLDLVMVWVDGVPAAAGRPIHALAAAGSEPKQFDGSFGGLDKLQVDGWEVDVSHCALASFERWLSEVHEGDGWQVEEWPQPLHSVAGFAYGQILADPSNVGARAQSALASFPPLLVTKSAERLAQDWEALRPELARCVERSDGWLFHQLSGPLVRVAYVAWLAAQHRYCPFPKHLRSWAIRLSLDPALVDAERQMWNGTLADRLDALTTFVEGILRWG
ncbi:hypothetical protein [Tenggerimyces flavus]|uniref:DUF4111 domain-containing protein n=1 Tax=Tenggerimyces flavus TaxID=1708749 RepID=A0ABV7Y834_9ACTN|nr:hypothetical protein [Tenggerimyces flavus]MBM7785364.1 hypothetical protein [Tenggerimyces flavus]